MKNWLEIAAGIYLLIMVLYGHYRGFFRMAVSMVSLILAFGFVRMAMPSVASFIKNQTPVHGWIKEGIKKTITPDESGTDQQSLIESLDLPYEIEKFLLENDTLDRYKTQGENVIADYISTCLTDWIINGVGFVLLFILVSTGMHLLIWWLDIMARLPVISGINKLAGALLGGLQGLFFLWLFFLLVTAFSRTGWGAGLIRQIEASKWLGFLYHYNIVVRIVMGLIKGVF